MSSNQRMLDFGMQVLEASLSPLPSPCRILKFDNVADAVTFSQTINLVLTGDIKVVLPFSRRKVGGEFLMLATLAYKRDQREVWLKNPMSGMYTVKINGETVGEFLTPEQADEDAEIEWEDQELQVRIAMENYRPPTPSS